MNRSIRGAPSYLLMAAFIFFGLFANFCVAQQKNEGLPKVESANIMDIGRAPGATVEAERQSQVNQPGNNAPIWRTANSDAVNYVSIPNKEAGVLIQKSGQQWRLIRNGVITVYGAWLLALALAGVIAMYVIKGSIKLHEPMTGIKIKRFNLVERVTHWVMAFSFIALACTGLMILYGKYFVLPLIGDSAFGNLLFVFKNIHNFTGPLFTLSVLIFFIQFVRRNIFGEGDMNWLRSFGGIFSGKHVPAGFFNFGEKFWFWFGMVFLGLTISASGWVLDMIVPFLPIEYWRGTMQLANIIHSVGALLMTAMTMGHIYIGTLGMPGSIDGMKTGYVDQTWAKEHHELWFNKIK